MSLVPACAKYSGELASPPFCDCPSGECKNDAFRTLGKKAKVNLQAARKLA